MDRPLAPSASTIGGIASDTTTEIALRSIVARCHADLLKYRAMVLASRRAVGIHQTRVALRRLRAAFTVFRPAIADGFSRRAVRVLSAEAKWLAAECAPARDLHVFLTETVEEVPPAVAKVARRVASVHLERARTALSGARCGAFDRALADFLDETPIALGARLDEFGTTVLEQRHDKAVRSAHKLHGLDRKRLHRLRIAIKKLRYAAEFLRPAFEPRKATAYIEATVRLQGALGAMNDHAVADQMIADIATAALPAEDVARPLRRLARQAASGKRRRRRRLERSWKRFRKAERFWGTAAK